MYKDKKCGSCKRFMNGCRKRRSTNSCDKPACDRYEARTINDIVRPRLPITGQYIPSGVQAQKTYRTKYDESII